jgi:hypothetical protein
MYYTSWCLIKIWNGNSVDAGIGPDKGYIKIVDFQCL